MKKQFYKWKSVLSLDETLLMNLNFLNNVIPKFKKFEFMKSLIIVRTKAFFKKNIIVIQKFVYNEIFFTLLRLKSTSKCFRKLLKRFVYNFKLFQFESVKLN